MRVTLLIGCLALPAVLCAQPRVPADPTTAATVNGEAISLAQVDRHLAANLRDVALTLGQQRNLRRSILNDLIDDMLLKQFLAKNAPKVDPAELEAQMKALQTVLTKQNRTFEDYLKQTGQTESEMRAFWAMQIQLAAYVKNQVTDEQLKAFFAANKEHFDRVEVRPSHILIRANRTMSATERAKAREKLIGIRGEIVAGKIDFATAAKKFSECPTAKDGGDLGFIRRRGMPEDEPLAKAAFALKPGELSDIIETDYGFHILSVKERKPGKPTTLEKCVVEVLEEYTDEYRGTLVKKLRKEGEIKITLP
ncbi:MAG TPA: peptidylprolyl isomerase [Gemmata sp.]|nr:peptidylprolyl isomerase [Gemmata sp.]